MRDELPLEIQEWLQDIDSHKVAAERIGRFYMTMLGLIRNADHTKDLTQTWMMVCYGFPKNLPLGGKGEDD